MAENAESLVLVRTLTGPNGSEVQPTVEGAIAENYSVVSASKEEDAELSKGGAALVSMSREKKYRGYVTGEVQQTPKGFSLTLTVYSGKDGKATGSAKFEAKKLADLLDKVDNQAAKALDKALKQTDVASGEADKAGAAKPGAEKVTLEVDLEADAEEEEDSEPVEADDDGERPSALDINAAIGFMNLSLSYKDPVADSFGFALLGRPSTPVVVRAGGHWYPAAHFTGSTFADIGIAASYYQTLVGSIDVGNEPSSVRYDLVFVELNIGVRGRVRFGKNEVGLNVGMGQSATTVLGDNEVFANNPTETDPGLFPDISYTYFRVGIDGRVEVATDISVDAGFYFRLPSLANGPGQLAEPRWFPRASADGFEVQLSALYALGMGFSAQLGIDMRSYGLSMNSVREDSNVHAMAGGAEDRYLGVFAGLEWKL